MTISTLPVALASPTTPQPTGEFARQFTARSFLPTSAQSLWQIKTGYVRRVTWLEDGTIVVLGLWGPNDIVGKALMPGAEHQLECVTKVEAIPIPFEALDHPLEIVMAYSSQAEQLLQIRSYKRVEVVLLRFLTWLAQRFGQEIDRGRLIDLRLTHTDIAEAIGSTRVTVTRLLNQLRQQGMIDCLSLQRIIVREEEIWHYEI